MKILLWPVHGGYTDAFVRGDHEYLLPADRAQDPAAIGLDGWVWPRAREVPLADLRHEDIDVAVLQRPEEIELLERFAGRRAARDIPAVYLEHNAPRPDPAASTHPLADQSDIPIVHVTAFNQLFWDSGRARTVVIEHGLPDPGTWYTGDLARYGVVINEAVRRWRTTGTDLLPLFGETAPVDVFGIDCVSVQAALPAGSRVTGAGNLDPAQLRRELGRRRVYLHPNRWTSLGLSLIEAMLIGMPVIAVAATEAVSAVPSGAGVVSTDLGELKRAAARFIAHPDLALEAGQRARQHALRRFGHAAFLAKWNVVLAEAAAGRARRATHRSGIMAG
jgi:hypothetical protein